MLNLSRIASVLLLAVLGVACATGARLAPLTPAQETRLVEAQAALERVRVAYGRPVAPALRVRLRQPGDGAARFVAGVIYFDPSMLSPEIDYRPLLAHESAHWLRGDAGDAKCRGRMTDCEHAANLLGVEVLERGWGLTRDAAASLMCAQLTQDVADTQAGRVTTPRGHDFPLELGRFREAMKLWADCRPYAGATR